MNRLIFCITARFAISAPAHAQDTVPSRPVTILISIDGFRPDYLEQGDTLNLDRLKTQGVSSPMRPSFPTKTFLNHYTLVADRRPDHHGMVSNKMHLDYGSNARIAVIFCLAKSGWSILADEPQYPVTGGNHGHDGRDPEMQALFMAVGPSINPDARISLFDNVHVYPLLAKLVGGDALASDGEHRLLADAIN